jgi:peptidoglycan/xylan/chitin deacetylase (PgdA/CDA1 family)
MVRFRQTVTFPRRIVKAVYLRFLFFTGLLRLARFLASRRGAIVLTLHQIVPDSEYNPSQLISGMAIRSSTFERLLDYISTHCAAVTPEHVLASFEEGRLSERPCLAITFDDGWKDNVEVAFPLSRRFAIPFTVFVCPGLVATGQGFWTSRMNHLWLAAVREGKLRELNEIAGFESVRSAECMIEQLKRLPAADRDAAITAFEAIMKTTCSGWEAGEQSDRLLTWPDIQELSKAGIAFGSHTNSHAILTRISTGDAAAELRESKRAIEAKLKTCRWFAFPNGDWSVPVRKLVIECGYELAFINSQGIWEPTHDRFSVPRNNVWEGSLTGLDGRFSRVALEYSVFWKAWRAKPKGAKRDPIFRNRGRRH